MMTITLIQLMLFFALGILIGAWISWRICRNKYVNYKELNSEQFYDLMQKYRNAPISNQAEVINTFVEVKEFIINNIK